MDIETGTIDQSTFLDTNRVVRSLKNHGFNMYNNSLNGIRAVQKRPCPDTDSKPPVDEMMLIEPIQLYNILMQMEEYPCVSDPTYLLLLGLFFLSYSINYEVWMFPFSFYCLPYLTWRSNRQHLSENLRWLWQYE